MVQINTTNLESDLFAFCLLDIRFGRQFELPLLAQSFIMIGAMMMMLRLCTKIRRESDMSARKRSFLGKYELVSWNYKEIQVGSTPVVV